MPRASTLPEDIQQFQFGEYTRKCVPLPLDGLTEALATEYIRSNARPKWMHEGERKKLVEKARSSPGAWIRYIGGNGFDKSLARRIGRIVDGRRGVTWSEVDAALDGDAEDSRCKAQERQFRDFFKTGDFRVRLLGLRTRAGATTTAAERPASPSLKRVREPEEDVKHKNRKKRKEDKPDKTRRPGWVQPLDSLQQTMLYCGHNQDLWKYLKERKLERYNNPATWKGIREWTYTPRGRKWLKSAGMTPEGVALDHIHPKAGGRIDHPYNCFLMPTSVNSYFRDRTDKEKGAYIGDLASTTAGRFVTWYIDETRKHRVDCSKFSGAGL
jgi:hypothetical protein